MCRMNLDTWTTRLTITGNSDLVDHKSNGYLAEPFDVNDLAKGINWVLYSSEYGSLADNARNKVLQSFDNKVVAPKYIELYQSVLEKENP